MEIIYLENNEINKTKWDETIANSSHGTAYVYSWYLDAVFPNWSAFITEDYKYVFPVTLNSQYKIAYFFTPIFAMQFGVFSNEEITEEIENLFWNAVLTNTKAIDISLHPGNKFVPKNIQVLQKQCQIIDLSKSYTEISKHYNSNLKRNLTKAIKLNLRISTSENIQDVVGMFRNGRGNKIADLKEVHYINLHKLIQNGLKANQVKIFECYEDREIIAAGFFTFCNNRIIYHKGGANHKGRKYGAMHLIIDSIIREYASTGMVFDFGGSSIDSVRKFNFNFTQQEYLYPVYKKSNFMLNIARKIKNRLTKAK